MQDKQRFLIIDDSRAVHAFVKDTTKLLGYEMVSAFDGKQGLDILSQDKNFSFVLLDWEMPVMDGPTTLEHAIKILPPHVPISMMTSKNSFENITYILSLGAKEYIMKPFTKDILIDKINYLTSLRKAS